MVWWALLALALVLLVTGCSGDSGESATTAATTTATSDDASARPTTTSADGAQFTSGSYTTTIGNTEVTYQAAYLIDGIDVELDGGDYVSTSDDEVVFLVVNGGSLTLTNATVDKSGDASTSDSTRTSDVSDDYNFYGLNSAIVVVGDGSSATIDGTTITTSSEGSNAIVATDSGTADVTNVDISTTGSSARGLHATYGGSITGADLTIATQGDHCADVATDRGGGTVTVTGTNTFTTEGDGSPLVYSTGDISVSGVTGTASASEIVVVEGKNSASITDSDVSASGDHAAMIYQSMSGDAADSDAATSVGAVTFTDSAIAFDGSGAVLYFTNTTADLTIENTTIEHAVSLLASAAEDDWGTSGSNGATVTLTVSGGSYTGSIEAGDSSSIAVTLLDDAVVDGTTVGDVTVSEG